MSSKIAILTDSTNDLPGELIEKHNIYVIPEIIVWGEERRVITGADLLGRLLSGIATRESHA